MLWALSQEMLGIHVRGVVPGNEDIAGLLMWSTSHGAHGQE